VRRDRSSSEAVEAAAAEAKDGSMNAVSVGGNAGSGATTADTFVVEKTHDRR
jgi:hypothetical protein